MASSRAIRKSSRTSSPAVNSTRSSAAPESIHVQPKGAELPHDEFDETTGRVAAFGVEGDKTTPAPPTEATPARDGTPVQQRVKLRVKEWHPPGSEQKETPRDNGAGGQGTLASFSATGKEPGSRFKRRLSPVGGAPPEDRPMKRTASRKRSSDDLDEQETSSAPRGRSGPEPSAEITSPTSFNGGIAPSSKTEAGRPLFRNIVEAAVERSRMLGNELLGLALRRLFDESAYNPRLAHLLDSVLAQSPTPQEAHEFQAHVKAARKKIKAENSQTAVSGPEPDSQPPTPAAAKPVPVPKSKTKSPSKRPQRASARTASVPAETATRLSTRNRTNGRSQDAAKDDGPPPAKRARRSGSVSSASSLSSAHSAQSYGLELEAAGITMADDRSLASMGRGLPGHQRPNQAGKGRNGTKRSAEDDAIEQQRDAARSKFQKLQKYSERTSYERDGPVPKGEVREPRDDSPEAVERREEHMRSVHRAQERHARMVSEESSQGETLIPPPLGASRHRDARGETPTALGRPRKDMVRKTARIKVSPQKKRTGTPAGNRTLRERDSYPNMSGLSQSQTPSQLQMQREPSVGTESNDSDRRWAATPTILDHLLFMRLPLHPHKRPFETDDAWYGVDMADEDPQGENQDHCSACHGSGELLCCDGCVRSFHFECLDPPGDPEVPPEGEWLCHACVAKRHPQARRKPGLFSQLNDQLDKQNAKEFALSRKIRDFFEGVCTGEDGEYEEEETSSKPKPIRGLGYDDQANDNLRLKDAKGNFILCYRCGLSAMGKREIIPCDYCDLKFHLDCLNPPLANPPLKDPLNKGRNRYKWMCPCHAPTEFQIGGHGGQPHKLRRPRNPVIVDTQLRRGFQNNGIIEIDNDPSDDEQQIEEGVVYRVSERSIKLDFIDKCRRERDAAHARREAAARADQEERLRRQAEVTQAQKAFSGRTLVEQNTALSLAQLADQEPTFGVDGGKVHLLVTALLNDAPAELLGELSTDPTAAPSALLGDGSAKNSSKENGEQSEGVEAKAGLTPAERRKQLLLLQELITRKLKEDEPAGEEEEL